jgi:hypothetical protein
MSDRPAPSDTDPEEEEFTPKGALFLTVLYIIIFAAAWGLIYFNDLLARR